MRVTLATLLTLVAYVAAQADPSINTPAQLVQCQPAQITWTATNGPAFISIIPGGQPGAAALKDFGQQTGNSLTWNVDIPAGQSITFQCRDSRGQVAYSAPATVQNSSDSSCLGQNPSSSPGGSSAPAPTSSAAQTSIQSVSSVAGTSAASVSSSAAASTSEVASSSSAAVSTSSRASATSASSTRSAASATSASASASAAPNSARSNAKVGFAGLLGLAAAVVMA